MGCYSQSCVVSRLEIGDGDKCGVIPILKNNGGSINDSIFHMYNPFCFPIFGRYNDYGGLKDIVEDDNTAAICKYFDMDIYRFMEAVEGRRSLNIQSGINLKQSFIRKDVYDKFISKSASLYNKERKSFGELDWEKEDDEKYIKLVKDLRSIKTYLNTNGKIKGVKETLEAIPMDFLRDNFWYGSGMKHFDNGEDFLGIYEDVLLAPSIWKIVDEFNYLRWGMVKSNIVLLETNSFEQWGQVSVQKQLIKVMLDVASKLSKTKKY